MWRQALKNQAYILPSLCPILGLATEEALYRNLESLSKSQQISHYLLFLWRSRPSVVLGRFQNPWHELNLDATENTVEILRRRSGGGCVYHDEGNLNVSLMGPRSMHDEKKGFTLLREIGQQLGLKVKEDGRNGMLLEDGRKFSGSAYRLGHVALHHFTLLFDANLDQARTVLQHQPGGQECNTMMMEMKGVQSVPSSVANLKEVTSVVNIEQLLDVVHHSFEEMCGESGALEVVPPCASKDEIDMLQQWEWVFGETPTFRKVFPEQGISMVCDRGVVKEWMPLNKNAKVDPWVAKVAECWVGHRYGKAGYYRAVKDAGGTIVQDWGI